MVSFISSLLGTLAPSRPILHNLTNGPIVMSQLPLDNFEYSIPFFNIS